MSSLYQDCPFVSGITILNPQTNNNQGDKAAQANALLSHLPHLNPTQTTSFMSFPTTCTQDRDQPGLPGRMDFLDLTCEPITCSLPTHLPPGVVLHSKDAVKISHRSTEDCPNELFYDRSLGKSQCNAGCDSGYKENPKLLVRCGSDGEVKYVNKGDPEKGEVCSPMVCKIPKNPGKGMEWEDSCPPVLLHRDA